MAEVLIIDDDEGMRYSLSAAIKQTGHNPFCAATLADGFNAISSKPFDVVFLDVNLPDGDGLSASPKFKAFPSCPEVIIITGYGNPDGAELAIRSGAWEYIEKGTGLSQIKLRLTRALEYRAEKRKYESPVVLNREGIIGNSQALQNCIGFLAQAAVCNSNVLVTGETGTGKELFARAIHGNSAQRDKNLVVVDCAALPENLVESVLFGHEKGAFTGADRAEDGLVKRADGGTLFLDEVGELPLKVQKAFLRVLQEHSFRPVGSKIEKQSDFRLVSATNRDLNHMVTEGRFREDLLFRLRSLAVTLPPLRDRTEDIRELATHYADRLCDRYGLPTKDFSPEFLEALQTYDWPGNVRELIASLENSISEAQRLRTLFPIHLPIHIRAVLARASIQSHSGTHQIQPGDRKEENDGLPNLHALLEATERHYIEDLLSFTAWDMKKAGAISGLSRSRLYGRLKKYEIKRPS
ncbi:MAG: sigma-54-dependent Fis family transcriptional regulator [Deltaproteobacteria bacterium]|nr:sigma-54-dependent Fis family transcriptional regulator [Deltaproteobacteria bacterium]